MKDKSKAPTFFEISQRPVFGSKDTRDAKHCRISPSDSERVPKGTTKLCTIMWYKK